MTQLNILKLADKNRIKIFIIAYIITVSVLALATIYFLNYSSTLKSYALTLYASEKKLKSDLGTKLAELNQTKNELDALKSDDQFVRNNNLQKEIDSIQKTYKQSVITYEDLIKLREQTTKTQALDKLYSQVITDLSKRDYVSGSAHLDSLQSGITKLRSEVTAAFTIPANVAANNTAPGSGYSRQKVTTDFGEFLVDIVAADLNSTRVIVDTASDSDCRDNCPVLPLGDYAGRSGAFAAINGPYFCPASYPSCAGKTNTFDTLIMNKKKTYFNSDNNVYSSVPAVIFSGSSGRFVGASSEWGRDTGPDSVIAAQPMLLSGGNVVFGGDSEIKRAGAGSRSFIGTKGSTVYIGVVHNANVAQVARILKTMGIEYALNLDSGGSTALMSGGKYVVGPGRALPLGILLVRK